MFVPKNSKSFKHRMKAVSPVIATLVLIVIAIVGAVAVGLILSRVVSSTSNSANVGGVASASSGTLSIGGSTTIYPVTALAQPTFEAEYPQIQLLVAQGGSGAGMQGVISGALDLGAASSSSAVYQAVTYVASNSIIGVTITPTLVGGSGVVFITNLVGSKGAFLTDGSANLCEEMTAKAINEMYTDNANGQFYIGNAACATNVLQSGGVLAAAGAGEAGPYQTFGRADNSGTQDTVTSWLTGSTVSVYPYGGSIGETGNAGMLSAVQACKAVSGSTGCIGFADIGFAAGRPAGVSCPSGVTAGEACGVAIVEASSSDTAPDALNNAAATSGVNGYVAPGPTGGSTSNLESFIEKGLVGYATINPTQTPNPSTYLFPDSGGSLARTFYYVSNGLPTPVEQDWLNFITSPNSEAFFTNNGYYSVYQFSGA